MRKADPCVHWHLELVPACALFVAAHRPSLLTDLSHDYGATPFERAMPEPYRSTLQPGTGHNSCAVFAVDGDSSDLVELEVVATTSSLIHCETAGLEVN